MAKIVVLNEIPLDRSGGHPKYSGTTMYIPRVGDSGFAGFRRPVPPLPPHPPRPLGAALRARGIVMKGFVSLACRLRLPLGAAALLSAGCGGTSTSASGTAPR